MKKMMKTLLAAVLAGSMCFSALALTACDEKTKEVPGKSAYEIAVDNGFKGTEAEWLESLKVTTEGKSAYEIAKDNGFKGTEAEWLESLKVTTEGKSAYEIAVENGFKGTEAEWLESLKVTTEGKSAYELAVENGFKGTQAEWLESLKVPTPTTVKDKKTTYSVNEDGQTVVTVTLTMSDDTKQVVHSVVPRRVISAHIYDSYTAVILTSEEAEQKNLIGLRWSVRYDDGSEGYLPLQASQILSVKPARGYGSGNQQDDEGEYGEEGNYGKEEEEQWDGTYEDGHIYEINAIFSKYWDHPIECYVYICDDLTTLDEYKDPYAHGEEPEDVEYYSVDMKHEIPVGESIDLKTLGLNRRYQLWDKLHEAYDNVPCNGSVLRYVEVTEDMLGGDWDTSTTGDRRVTITYDGEVHNEWLYVYDPEVTLVDSMWLHGDNDIVITEGGDIDQAMSALVGETLYVNYYVNVNGTNYEEIAVTEDMLDYSNVDADTPGYYTATISYAGYSTKIYVNVIPDMSQAQKEHTVQGMGLTILTLTEGIVVTQADLYDNGYCELYAPVYDYENPDAEPVVVSLAQEYGYMPYVLNGNTLEVGLGDEKIAIFTVDTEEGTFEAYEFDEDDLVDTYVCDMKELPFTLKVYNNGYGELIAQMGDGEPMVVVVGYVIEGNVLTLLPSISETSLEIGEDNKLTFIM